mgnify:CR=1 FL=1
MNKRLGLLIVALGIISGIAFTGFSVWHSSRMTPVFDTAGYILCGDADEGKWLSFRSGAEYTSTLSGSILFSSPDTGRTTVSKESFAYFDDNSMMALSDGILLDFKDLSDNFINNYYLNAGLRISNAGGTYVAETSTGTMEFGEYLWKLSNQKFVVVSPTLKVHMSDDDVREVNDYVQVTVTNDKVVHLLTPENLWMTISEDCYIETEGGVQIYPVTQLIDNGNYKMSLAKLSVNMDDAIILTEDETRRQIVPELKIEGVDGEDGQDGEDGKTGRDGEEGTPRAEGAEGLKGEDGKAGTDGKKGSNGSAGAAGPNGESGSNGGNGHKGNDADTSSSVNNPLPTMTITDWQVSATRLCGMLKLNDQKGMLSAIADEPEYQTKYMGAVTITNTKTGDVINCYQVYTNSYDYTGTEEKDFNFYQGDEFYFTTAENALEPDTEYKLSVTAYYKMSETSEMVFSREFVGRIFYTDSTGVVLSYESATENSLTISATVSDSYASSISKATVYLLTPDQNKEFNIGSFNDTSKYIGSQVIGGVNSSEPIQFMDGKASVTFDGLDPNKHYIARVYVETTGSLNSLTQQAFDAMTLKRTPTKKEQNPEGMPAAYYNRATGAFEVFRPVMVDPDGGAESYTYTAYYHDSNGWVKASSRTITASTSEPVEFHLDSGKEYRFGVEMTFNDNEKQVIIDLGQSNSVQAMGDTMPRVTLEISNKDYNNLTGIVKIKLGSNSYIDVTQPITLSFYADQVSDLSVKVKKAAPVASEVDRYTVTLDTTSVDRVTNECNINIDLKNLKKNTNYSVTVSGALNLGDGNDFLQRAIGTVSFHTFETLTMSASWNTPSTTGYTFARTLKLSVADSEATSERASYALSELKGGQVTVELFSGTGAGKLRIAQKNFNQEDELNKLFSETGIQVTDTDFGTPTLSKDGVYTLTVTEVVDPSYRMNLGYVNDFDKILNSSEVVTAEPTPPDLLKDPSKGIKAEPIYNVDAGKYDGKVNETLPDDAIVGYTLEATYDNVQRIGLNITYYAYEYKAFFNALNSGDPLKTAEPLMKMTQPIDTSKDTVPKIALFFGGTKTADADAIFTGGCMRYYAGEPNQQDASLSSGMGRGYRYIFAYTVEYSSGNSSGEGGSSTNRTYPYDHKDYENYKYYGGVKENNIQVGKNVAYILNSGMCEAPQIMPDFHTYVYSTTPDELPSSGASASGSITLHYSWRDTEGLVVTGLGAANTKISYQHGPGTVSQDINKDLVAGNWYEITMKYSITTKDGKELLVPTVNLSEYKLDYTTVLKKFSLTEDEKDYPVAKIPLDWSWEKEFTKNSSNLPLVQVDMTHMDDNYIAFNLITNPGSDAMLESVASRAVAMRLTIKQEGGKVDTFTLPISTDVKGTYFGKLVTGDLGQDYLGKQFTLEKAELLYDTGIQGWNIAATEKEFTVQYTNEKNIADAFEFSRYMGASNNNQIFANGALMQLSSSGNFTLDKLRNCVSATEKDDSKLTFSLYRPIAGNHAVYYLYPDRMGVDVDTSNMSGRYSGEYAVPKHLGALDLKINGNATNTLTKITPTMVNEPYFVSSSSGFTVSNLKVSGLKAAAAGEPDPTIRMAVYESQDEANRLGAPVISPIDIAIGSDGLPSNGGENKEFSISGLTDQKTYYVAFYYLVDGKSVLLLKSGGAKVAIYPVTTTGNVEFKVTEIEYKNEDYFNKELLAKFTVNRTYNVSLRYDLFDSQAAAESPTGTPLLSYEELKGDGRPENSILAEPSLSSVSENVVKIILSPSTLRKKIVPGGTYYLKISASEKQPDGNFKDAGYVVKEFTITTVGNYGALIYVKNATRESITYQVTINDPQHSFMERKPNTGVVSESALYAVRFTDENDHWIHTTYDDEVYRADELRKEFVLQTSNLKNKDFNYKENTEVIPSTFYKLNVYAVPDADHDGIVKIGGQDKSWKDFFDKAEASLAKCGQKFLDIVNSLWKTDLTPDSTQGETEKTLLVASKTQSTTTNDGWLLNTDEVFASRYNTNTIRVVLQESVGLIDPSTNDPVFKKIEWSVNGFKSDGTPLSASGTQKQSVSGDKLLRSDTIGGKDGYDVYYFEIPYDLDQGNYTIVMKLYQQEDQVAATETITVRSAG